MENKGFNTLFFELLLNVYLPVKILENGAKFLGENGTVKALVLATAVPVCYAIVDYLRNKKINIISVLGIISVLSTGLLGYFQAEGKYFAYKEAFFPGVIGLVVLISAFTKKPLIKMLMYNDAILKTDMIEESLSQKGTKENFDQHLKLSTIFFALSFFFSAILNYVLAMRIFTPIDQSLDKLAREQILNEQIAEMTWQGYVVILVPSLIILFAVLWHLFSGIKKYTGHDYNDVLRSQK